MNNFFNKGQFHFDVSSRRVSFPFKCRKVIFRQSRRLKSPNFPLSMNHGHNTDFSKLINLCLVKKFSLISTPGIFQSGFILFYFFSFMLLPETRCYNATSTLSLWTPEQEFTTGNIQCFSWQAESFKVSDRLRTPPHTLKNLETSFFSLT